MAKVKLENGRSITMSELQIGDRVQTGEVYLTQNSPKAQTKKTKNFQLRHLFLNLII